MTIFVGVIAATSLVMALGQRASNLPHRLPYVAADTRPSPTPAVTLPERLGARVRKAMRRTPNADRDRQVGVSLFASGVVGLVSPLMGAVVFLGANIAGKMRTSRDTRRREELVAARLAEVVDLFAVTLRSGHNMTAATAEVGRWIDGPVGEGFAWCSQQSAQGEPIADALEELPARLGPIVRPLVSALVANERHGAPIVAGLAQLAADHRSDRRRRAETAARRLPVHLLMPLILCVLPAFLLLTVVPVVAETFRNLDVFGSP